MSGITIGVMQPYFFPYLGYWQLFKAVDKYVIFDDVNYIKRGWIARNRIKSNGEAVRFGISVSKVSQNKKICEHNLANNSDQMSKLSHEIYAAYHKAPYFNDVSPLIDEILNSGKINLADFLSFEIRKVCEYLGIKTEILRSSELDYDREGHGPDKILSICHLLGGSAYVNAIGGRELYDQDMFRQQNIDLSFIQMDDQISYLQGDGDFIPSLSIIDVMMWNSVADCNQLLNRYTLIK